MPQHDIPHEYLDALEAMVLQHCQCYDDGTYDSGALSANAQAMRLLARSGRFAIHTEAGRRIIGAFTAEAQYAS